MTTTKNAFECVLEDLQQQRDELKLQMHFAKPEARDEWWELERKWVQLKPKLDAAGNEALDPSGKVFGTLNVSVEELLEGYARIRKLLH